MKFSLWDVLTIAVLAVTFIVAAVVLIIFINPDSSINPFPLPTLPPTVMVPSPTPTLLALPPTWTPTPQVEATRRATSTPVPTSTPLILPTATK